MRKKEEKHDEPNWSFSVLSHVLARIRNNGLIPWGPSFRGSRDRKKVGARSRVDESRGSEGESRNWDRRT